MILLRSLKNNNVASASVFVAVIMLFVVFGTLDYVIDSDYDSSVDIKTDFELRFADVLGEDGLPANWSIINQTEREDYLDDLHGCTKTFCWGNPFDDYTDWFGMGYQWHVDDGGDGMNMHANDYLALTTDNDDNPDGIINFLQNIIIKFWSVLALDFNFFTHLDWFAWVIKFPMWSALIYCIVKALPFT